VILEPHAKRVLDDALSAGPVVIAASHTGNWETAAFAAARELARKDRHLAIVAKPMSSSAIDRFLVALRSAHGITCIAPRGAIAAARAALARGDVVAMPIDQVPDRDAHALRDRFLGEMAWIDRGPATIAARAGATLLVTATKRSGRDQVVSVLAVVPPPRPHESRHRWIHAATRTATAALERFVRASPGSWLWLHRRWRAPRATRPRLVPAAEPG
jgi:KDO2-lipid IV(A) lauroyltransferase